MAGMDAEYATAADLLAKLRKLEDDGTDLSRLYVDVLHSGGTYGARAYRDGISVGPTVGGLDGEGQAVIISAT